ncbi:hypothetical protein C8J56DRAFT_925235 [Mycena floridula]|nr:hypothetical protein C8J56DRAFT_925235 [Mycena floridula]
MKIGGLPRNIGGPTKKSSKIHEHQPASTDIDGLLTGLESRKSAAEETLRCHRAIAHPLRRIPPELLREIFRICLDRQSSLLRRRRHRRGYPEFPWNLTYVCQRWHEIAISFSYLWSSINHSVASILSHRKLQLMLERSASSLLDITLHDEQSNLEDSHQIVRALLPSSFRWRRLTVSVNHMETLTPIHGHLDNLAELHLSFFGERNYDEPFNMFEVAPMLKKIDIDYSPPVDQTPRLLFPWSQITHYRLNSYDEDLFIQLEHLSLCVNLVVARFHLLNFSTASQISYDVVLPNLSLLALATGEKGVMGALLNRLKLPALKVLHLQNMSEWDAADQQSIGSLVFRSQCSLTSFGLRNLDIVQPSLVTFLSNNSSIIELLLCESDILVPHLHCTPTSVILPKLARIKLSIQGIPELFAMLESRLLPNKGCERTIRVQVSYLKESRLDAEARYGDWLKNLREAGLTVVFGE